MYNLPLHCQKPLNTEYIYLQEKRYKLVIVFTIYIFTGEKIKASHCFYNIVQILKHLSPECLRMVADFVFVMPRLRYAIYLVILDMFRYIPF
jgi:hypothetical protein